MPAYSDDEFIRACEDELAVLDVIFPGDVTDLRRLKYDEHGAYIAPKLTIMLRPQESRIVGQRSSEYEAKLWIELSKAYPFKIPDKLAIEASPKVMSNQTRAQLQASLIKLAERKADEGEGLCVLNFAVLNLNNLSLSVRPVRSYQTQPLSNQNGPACR